MKKKDKERLERAATPPTTAEMAAQNPTAAEVPLSSLKPTVILDLMRTSAQARPDSGHPPHVPHLLAGAMVASGISPTEALATFRLDQAVVRAGLEQFGITRRVPKFELLVRLWAAMLDQSALDRMPLASRVVWEDIKARIEHHFPTVNEGVVDVECVILRVLPLLRCPMSREAFFDAWPKLPPIWPLAIRQNFGFPITPRS